MDCQEWSQHVIVCGLGGLGLRVVELLHLAGVAVVVVDDDPDPRLMGVVTGWGVPHVPGNVRLGNALWDAGLAGAQAVICVERTDLLSLETALLVRQMRPEVRIVLELANPAVGQAVDQVITPGRVLDVATLAAPSMVESCMRRSSHEFLLGGERFVTAEVVAEPEAGKDKVTIRHLHGDLVPIAVVLAEGGDLIVCPGRDHRVGAGDRITLLGTPADMVLGAVKATAKRPDGHTLARFRRARVLRRAIAAIFADTEQSVRLVGFGLILLFVLSVLVLRLGYRTDGSGGHLSLLKAAYFTVTTMATVGYGDYSFASQPTWLIAYGVFLIVAGVALVTTGFALFTNLLVSRRIAQSLGRQQVTGMSGHTVVVGLGAVGLRVLEGLLAEGVQVAVLERDENNRYLNRARALGVPVVIADATQRQTLESINLTRAAAVAVLTSDDLTNIETALAVQGFLGGQVEEIPVVIRIFDRALARTVKETFGFRHVLSTAELAAPWFVGAALGLEVIGTFYVQQRPFLVGSLSISNQSGLEGLSMQDLPARTRVVAINRSEAGGVLEHPPRRGTRFAAGDQAYILGPYEELLEVLLHNQRHQSVRARNDP
jgi:Trk K+ transport system NAD-binding subunit